jgi:hypothetical protein
MNGDSLASVQIRSGLGVVIPVHPEGSSRSRFDARLTIFLLATRIAYPSFPLLQPFRQYPNSNRE